MSNITKKSPYPKLTDAEYSIYIWQYHSSSMGGFETHLWKAIMEADGDNRARLSMGFPVECEGMDFYQNEKDWWPNVQRKLVELGVLQGK